MSSAITICNRALAAIGTRSTIASLTENSVEARNCQLVFEDTRDELLNMAFWNFAAKTALLSLIKSAPGTPSNQTSFTGGWTSAYPSPPWLYEYAYPTDAIGVRQVMNQINDTYVGVPLMSAGNVAYPFAVGTGAPFTAAIDTDGSGNQMNVILTNQYQAIAIYTARITNTELFSAQFTETLVQALAAKLAMPLTGQVALVGTKFQQANALVRAARASDGNEGLTVIDNMPDWITCREGLGGVAGINYVAPYAPLYGA